MDGKTRGGWELSHIHELGLPDSMTFADVARAAIRSDVLPVSASVGVPLPEAELRSLLDIHPRSDPLESPSVWTASPVRAGQTRGQLRRSLRFRRWRSAVAQHLAFDPQPELQYARTAMIEGVIISPRRIIPDERGKVMHMLKATDPEFRAFGEVYFSVIYPGIVKGWHLHHKMVINYAVPYGQIKLVLFDDRETSTTRGEVQEIFVGEGNHCLVQVPTYVWNGFKSVGTTAAIVANCATIPHDPSEIERLDPFRSHIPYDWAVKHG